MSYDKKPKGLRAEDAGSGISLNKRPPQRIETMGYPCSLGVATPSSRLGAKTNVPSDLDPKYDSEFGRPKSRYY